MSEWQPIETAPKDGSWIVIGKPEWDIFPKAQWLLIDADPHPFFAWSFADDYMCSPAGVDSGCLGWDEDIEEGNMPTHWMPLPEAPK